MNTAGSNFKTDRNNSSNRRRRDKVDKGGKLISYERNNQFFMVSYFVFLPKMSCKTEKVPIHEVFFMFIITTTTLDRHYNVST